jgi:hypothetical protein
MKLLKFKQINNNGNQSNIVSANSLKKNQHYNKIYTIHNTQLVELRV